MKKLILPAVFATIFALAANAQNSIASHCGTLQALSEFRNPAHHGGRAQTSPPTLTGTEVILNTPHFEIHYTLTGYDAVPALDNSGNTIPDYIDTIAAIAEYVYTTDQARSYMLPPVAAIGASNTLYDIYIGFMDSIAQSSGVYGLTDPFADIGDNPASSETELHSTTSYLALRNDFNTYKPGVAGSSLLSVTIAHEFSHAIDFSYNLWTSLWLSESRAVFEESVLYPNLNDNFQYFPGLLSHPDVALNLDDEDHETQHRNHFYSAWLFHRYIADHLDTNYLKPILELSRLDTNTSYPRETNRINDNLIYSHETNLKEQFSNFTIANYFLTNDNAYTPYTYGRGNAYRTGYGTGAVVEGNRNFTGAPTVWNSVTWGNSQLMRLSADYVAVTANQNFSVRLNAEGKDTSYGMTVIKIDTVHHKYEFAQAGWYHDSICAANIRDYADWNYFLVIVNRYDFYNNDTTSKQYEITIDAPLMFLNWSWPTVPLYTNNIPAVAVDKNNLLWTSATLTEFRYYQSGGGPYTINGVTSFNGFFWNHHHYFNSRRAPGTNAFPGLASDIDVSSDNTKWFAEANSGLYKYSGGIWENADTNNAVQMHRVDARAGTVWCIGEGAYELVGPSLSKHNVSTGELPENNTSALRLHGGHIYVGTANFGLVTLGGTIYNTSNGLPSNTVYDVEFEQNGNMWVGTWGGGIARHDTGWTIFDPSNPSGGYVSNKIYDIAIDDAGTVWVGNYLGGISRYKNGVWKVYNNITAPDFPANSVYDIAFDKHGCLWLGTDHGVVYFCDTTGTVTDITETTDDFRALNLFPNPAIDELNIVLNGIITEENLAVNIVNLNGEILKSIYAHAKSGLLKIDVSNLANGFYFVEIKNTRSKFVKL